MKDDSKYLAAITFAEKQLKSEIRFRFQLILLGLVWVFILIAGLAIGILVEDVSGFLRITGGFTVLVGAIFTIATTTKGGLPRVKTAREDLEAAKEAHLQFIIGP